VEATLIVRRPWPLAIAALVLFAGCGGGGSDASSEESLRPADPAYAKKANAVCAKAVRQTQQIGKQLTKAGISPQTPDLLAVTTEQLVRPGIRIRAQLADELRALRPPTAGAETVQAYLDLFDPLEELARLRLQAGVENDLEEARRLESLMQELGEEQQAAARLAGLEVCATNFVLAAFGN
jgi:hypothetical protein